MTTRDCTAALYDRCRRLVRGAAALAAVLVLVSACTESDDAATAGKHESDTTTAAAEDPGTGRETPADLVFPHLDTANSRWFFFDSASLPFGLVNLSPDTDIDGAWNSGYRYDTGEVKVFSHVHAWQLSGAAIMPTADDAPVARLKDDFASPFSHDSEVVRPGYHRLVLDRFGIVAELTATTRVGVHRYRFPDGAPRRFVLPLSGPLGPSEMVEGRLERIGDRIIAGKVVNGPTRRRPKPTPVFFRVELDADIAGLSVWQGDEVREDVDRFEGSGGGGVVTLAPGSGPVTVKVALSYVDDEGAARNMAAEAPGRDFDAIANAAAAAWNERLGRITVEGGTRENRVRFYTDLWHALQGRRIVSDVDGRYPDMTGENRRIGQLPLDGDGTPLHAHYNSDSFWGAQWTIGVLWPLAYPDVAAGMARSLLQYYRDGGLVPRGPSGGNYTYVMTGASSTPFVVSAWMKGLLAGEDPAFVYEALKKNHLPGGIMARAGYEHATQTGGGLEDYIELGYAPFPVRTRAQAFHQDGAGQTLEYAYQDWTLARFAEALEREDDRAYFDGRAGNWRNLYDPETGYIRPRNIDGEWKPDFDPGDYQEGHVESNAAQMTWFVPHDVPGLAEAMGGEAALIERLTAAFENAAARGFTAGKGHADEARERNRDIPINYGNQPSMQTAFVFHLAGAPWLTQHWSREVVEAVYTKVSPTDGYNGDEDQGLMGSLAVLMKIGLFQMNGGTDRAAVYQIGSPVFDRIAIELDPKYYEGDRFVIEARDNSSENRYIRSATLNGEALPRLEIAHRDLTAGGVLVLEMGPQPDKELK